MSNSDLNLTLEGLYMVDDFIQNQCRARNLHSNCLFHISNSLSKSIAISKQFPVQTNLQKKTN